MAQVEVVNNMEIPDFLKATYSMLSETFPHGISDEDYWVVLYSLYDYMADENLALVMSFIVNKTAAMITNDIYKVNKMDFSSNVLIEIKEKLDKHGFEEWKTSD